MRTIRYGLTTHAPSVHTSHSALIIRDTWGRTIHYGLTTADPWVRTIHNNWRPAISSNSVGVAISQPRVACEARYPGQLYYYSFFPETAATNRYPLPPRVSPPTSPLPQYHMVVAHLARWFYCILLIAERTPLSVV